MLCEPCDILLENQLISDNIGWSLFPNPSSGVFTIKTEEKILKMTIYNIMGTQIYYETNKNGIVHFNNGIQLTSGVYWILCTNIKGDKFLEKLLIIE